MELAPRIAALRMMAPGDGQGPFFVEGSERVETERRISVELRASAVVVRGEEILLIRHSRGGRSYWVLPGGHPHANEIASAAVQREVLEETGLRVEAGPVLFVWEGIAPNEQRRIAEIVFLGELQDRGLDPRSESALEEPAFHPIDEITSLPLYPPVAGYLRGAHRDGFDRGAPYLGNLWRSMTDLEDWASR
jgi:ADP-ribose pyrophosphatase YjhB (NUDIX family)